MEFDRFDICSAYLMIAVEWGEYALYDRLTRKMQFHAPMLSYDGMGENAQAIYNCVNDRYQLKHYGKVSYTVVYNFPGYLPEGDISEPYASLQDAWNGIENSAYAHNETIVHRSSMIAKLKNGGVYEITSTREET